jgi:hypothetical protein
MVELRSTDEDKNGRLSGLRHMLKRTRKIAATTD